MIRLLLLTVLVVIVGRAFWRLFDGIVEGATGAASTRRPMRSVAMTRDPVCGTFVVPDGSLSLGEGADRVYFCSVRCRDAFRTRQVRSA